MLQASQALHQLLLLKPWPWGEMGRVAVFLQGPGYFYMLPGPQLRACYPSTLFLCSCGPDGVPVAPREVGS